MLHRCLVFACAFFLLLYQSFSAGHSVCRQPEGPQAEANKCIYCKIALITEELLHAASHKAVNDLALWLYIYHEEGLTVKSEILLLIAIVTNLPHARLRKSFAYNSANYFIGEIVVYMQLSQSFPYLL